MNTSEQNKDIDKQFQAVNPSNVFNFSFSKFSVVLKPCRRPNNVKPDLLVLKKKTHFYLI